MDRGLKLTKPGVSLEKEPGRTGILGSRPLDLDLVAQICSARVLIAGVHAGSDGSGEMGRGAAALGHQRWLPAAASRWSSPELAKSGTPGVLSGGAWPGREYAACVIHLGLMRGAGRLGATCAKVVAAW